MGKSGNADQVYIENVVLPIASVTVNGAAATHFSYGAWQLPVNATVGLTLTLTDASGRATNVKIADVNPSDNTSTGTRQPVVDGRLERHDRPLPPRSAPGIERSSEGRMAWFRGLRVSAASRRRSSPA